MTRTAANRVMSVVAVALIALVVVMAVVAVALAWDTLGKGSAAIHVVDTRAMMARVTTGSILLSRHVKRSTRRMTVFNMVTSASDFYHVGMIVRHPTTGEPYVLDCMADGDACRLECAAHRPIGAGGPRLVPIMEYMLLYSLNPGMCAVRVLRGAAVDDARAWAACTEFTRYPFVSPIEIIPRLFHGVAERVTGRAVVDRDPQRGVFCSEVVARLLMRLDVMRPAGPAAFAPWTFCRAEFESQLIAPFRYSPPLVPDVFLSIYPPAARAPRYRM